MKKTDSFVKKMLEPKKSFTPPYETKSSLTRRLSDMYQEVHVNSVNAEGIFRCVK